jgi:hypothetical protein
VFLSENVFVGIARTRFGAIPADNQMIQDLADASKFTNCAANIHIVSVDANHAFQTHSIGHSTHNKGRDVEPVLRKQSSPDISSQLVASIRWRQLRRWDQSSHSSSLWE